MKSSVPRNPLVSDEDGSEFERLRGIEREYELETVAEHARQLVQFQAVSLRVLAGQASRTLGNFAALAAASSQAGSSDPGAPNDVRSIVGVVGALGMNPSSLPELPSVSDFADELGGVQTVLLDIFERVAKHYLKEQKLLRQIADGLREAYEAPFLGMRNEAEKWLVSGMKRNGRDRDEDFNDALRLLRASLDSPFGNGDYVAWFQLGWLLWQHEGNLTDAEDAFYKAQRLSAATADLYHHKSLRHLAYMQYLRGNYAGAYETVHKAIDIGSDYETRMEAARYAAMLGSTNETLRLLDQCVRERPLSIIAMFAEADFLRAPDSSKLLTSMAELATQLLAEARTRTSKNLQHWRMGLMVVEFAEKLIGHKIEMPDDVGPSALEQIPDVSQADYMLALEIDRRSLASGDKVLYVARDVLKREVRETTSVLGKAQGELEKLEFASKRRMTEAGDWKEEQIGEMPSLMKTLRGKGLLLNLLFPVLGFLMDLSGLPLVLKVLGVVVPDGQSWFTVPYNGSIESTLYLIYLYVSWVLYSYVIFAIAQICDVVIRRKQRLRIEKVYSEVVRVDEAQSSGELGALRKTVWEATRRKQRAEEALRLIEPQ